MAFGSLATFPKAIVVGGSLAGLFTALLLRENGWKVDVYERSAGPLSGRGAGIVTHPELFHTLSMIGVNSTVSFGVTVEERLVLNPNGTELCKIPLRQIVTSWDHLYRLLRERFPSKNYHTNTSFVSLDQDESGITAIFSSGEQARGDILIGADGIRSTVRKLLVLEDGLVYAGYVAWRGLVDEGVISATTRDMIFGRFCFCFPSGEQILGYPVAGLDGIIENDRRYNFVWYRPASVTRQLGRLLTDGTGRKHKASIPPNSIDASVIEEMRRDAYERLAPQFAELIDLTSQPFLQAIYDFESPRMVFGRVALVGDAAFVARPHVGMGVTKAAGDALSLAQALRLNDDDLPTALVNFEKQRLPIGSAVVAKARELGGYLAAPEPKDEKTRKRPTQPDPQELVRQIAVAEAIRSNGTNLPVYS